MDSADLQAALDAATATLVAGGIPRASLHARDVLALVACVSALRDVLAQTERERDETRAYVTAHRASEAAQAAYLEALTKTHTARVDLRDAVLDTRAKLLDAAAKCEEAMR